MHVSAAQLIVAPRAAAARRRDVTVRAALTVRPSGSAGSSAVHGRGAALTVTVSAEGVPHITRDRRAGQPGGSRHTHRGGGR